MSKYAKKVDKNQSIIFSCISMWLVKNTIGGVVLDMSKVSNGFSDLLVSIPPFNGGAKFPVTLFIEVKNPEQSWALTSFEVAFAYKFQSNYAIVETCEDVVRVLDNAKLTGLVHQAYSAGTLLKIMNSRQAFTISKEMLNSSRSKFW